MPRRSNSPRIEYDYLGAVIELLTGRCYLSEEQLLAAWVDHGDQLIRAYPGPVATRPWCWWRYVAGEEMPVTREGEAARLGELGELAEGELEAARGKYVFETRTGR